jgi:lipopolysaccharide biosynthesis protein
MFWARQGALLPLYDLGMNWEEYPEESLVHGSTLLDTIERIIPLVSQAQGYSYSLTYIPGINR